MGISSCRTCGKLLSAGVLSLAASLAFGAPTESRPARTLGYQFDISRCKVPTMAALRERIDLLSKLGYGQIQLYTEHTFAYRDHETVWRDASPMTADEIRELDAFCAERGVELVPNQNSFGHMEHWLRHPGYNDLAEVPHGGTVVKMWGDSVMVCPTTLCPTDPRSLRLVASLYDELLPCFRSKFVNVGCDETMELLYWTPEGNRSAAVLAEKGPAAVYVDFLRQIHAEVARRGHVMMFWGDIILHDPSALKDLPKDGIVAMNWGYEANHPFEREAAQLEKAGVAFYECPGTSAWGSLFGRVSNMMVNVTNAFASAERHGAAGVLLADWGDHGNPQPWLVSLPAIVFAANRAKGRILTREELAAEIDAVAGGKVGAALLAIGDVYRICGGRMGNSTEMFYVLKDGSDYSPAKGASKESVDAALAAYAKARASADLTGSRQFVKDGFAMLDLLAEAVELRVRNPKMPNFRAVFEPRYRELWLRQNRVGGLASSLTQVFGR